MGYLFIKYNDNWSDEMDISGFALVTSENWDRILGDVRDYLNRKQYWTYGVGTNEEIEYVGYSDWFRHFTVVKVLEHEALVLLDVFKRANIEQSPDETRIDLVEGFFPIPAQDEDDDYEDEDDEDDYCTWCEEPLDEDGLCAECDDERDGLL